MGALFSILQRAESKVERVYGYVKDQDDKRDWWHIFHERDTVPIQVNLTRRCGPVLDQGNIGSCTSNAIAGAYEFDERMEDEKHPFTPSRLFIYYNERDLEDSVEQDSGASLRDGIKTIAKMGVCPEGDGKGDGRGVWPYDITKFAVCPPKECYDVAQHHRAVQYRRVTQTPSQLKRCLAAGYPIVFGFVVYESFEGDEIRETGVMSMPEDGEQILGGHAVMAIGYDDEVQAVLVRNSWGADWGNEGNFWMPYDFIFDPKLANDFWTIKRVSDETIKK